MDWRRRRRVHEALKEVPHVGRSGEQRIEDAEQVERVLDAAEQLSDLSRQAFVLRFVQGDSYERVGEVIGKTAHQARGLCHAAPVEIQMYVPEDKTEVKYSSRDRTVRIGGVWEQFATNWKARRPKVRWFVSMYRFRRVMRKSRRRTTGRICRRRL
ncbi:MAG TPA: hypothetical protein VF669_18160 [Tepidisphaeraceae bacterium]